MEYIMSFQRVLIVKPFVTSGRITNKTKQVRVSLHMSFKLPSVCEGLVAKRLVAFEGVRMNLNHVTIKKKHTGELLIAFWNLAFECQIL